MSSSSRVILSDPQHKVISYIIELCRPMCVIWQTIHGSQQKVPRRYDVTCQYRPALASFATESMVHNTRYSRSRDVTCQCRPVLVSFDTQYMVHNTRCSRNLLLVTPATKKETNKLNTRDISAILLYFTWFPLIQITGSQSWPMKYSYTWWAWLHITLQLYYIYHVTSVVFKAVCIIWRHKRHYDDILSPPPPIRTTNATARYSISDFFSIYSCIALMWRSSEICCCPM